MKKILLIFGFLAIIIFCGARDIASDLTIVGPAHAARSLGVHTKGFIDCLKDTVSVTLVPSSLSSDNDLPSYITEMVVQPQKITELTSPVVIYTDSLRMSAPWKLWTSLNVTGIRIAFLWVDQTILEPIVASRLNDYFDLVIVPDACLVEICQKANVTIPIFVLPESIALDPFLSLPLKTKKNTPFVFGCSAMFDQRKNYELLLEAFTKEFGEDPLVRLRLHGWCCNDKKLKTKLLQRSANNVEVTDTVMTREEYVRFFASLNCYVLISKAESFSITPREALAAGIPCILSNNTAHKTICDSGCAYAVPSEIKKAFYCTWLKQNMGFQFDCELADVRKALRTVYEQYDNYLTLAQQGRSWVQQYLPQNLSSKYTMLVKPIKVVLGDKNCLLDDGIMTNSPTLYAKYTALVGIKQEKLDDAQS